LKVRHVNLKKGRLGELRTFLFWGWINIHTRVERDSSEWKAIVAHESKHWEQYKISYGLHPFLYKFSKSYRYQSELEAYAEEIVSLGKPLLVLPVARIIADDYGLDVTPQQAWRDLHAIISRETKRIENNRKFEDLGIEGVTMDPEYYYKN